MSIFKTFAIFAKFWEKGKVKTRLAKTIGDEPAAELFLRFLRASMKIVDQWDGRRVIGFSPAEKCQEFRNLSKDWELIPQITGDLGDRMRSFFDTLFCPDSESTIPSGERSNPLIAPSNSKHLAVLIGSDSPLLPRRIVNQAFEELVDHDVVLGPSDDGGYYLIGARNSTPNIFADIEWSSGSVFEQTINRLETQNYSYSILAPHRDIDDAEDLTWMIGRLLQSTDLNDELLELLHYCQATLTDVFEALDPGGSRRQDRVPSHAPQSPPAVKGKQ